MTHATKPAPRVAAIPAAMLAALLLAGCSTGHIGESWQCPLAEGGTCDSVAAADPAVPDPDATGGTALAEPLWRVRGADRLELPTATPCPAACGEGFDPFAWLARLFGSGDTADRAEPGDTMTAAAGSPPSNPSAPGDVAGEAEPAASSTAQAGAEPRPADPAAALLPAPGSRPGQAPEPAQNGPEAGDLRTDEVVARIWIAPYVDANGVYREASHVRVVLEPAGWRLK